MMGRRSARLRAEAEAAERAEVARRAAVDAQVADAHRRQREAQAAAQVAFNVDGAPRYPYPVNR